MYILDSNLINNIVLNIHNPKPKDNDRNLLGRTIAIQLIFRYIDINSIEKHIRKLRFIESKEIENLVEITN